MAKLTSLGVATIVLCGAVGIASTIAQQRREPTDSPDRADTVGRITGAEALLPDQLERTLPSLGSPAPDPTHHTPGHVHAEAPAVTPPVAAGQPRRKPAVAGAEPTTAPQSLDATAPTQAPTASDIELVRRFYEHLPAEPDLAFGLISSDLLGSTLGQFLNSWSLVHSVEVLNIEQRGDSVLAVVRLHLSDGSHLQLQQLLTVADSPRRITGAQLLSAQRN